MNSGTTSDMWNLWGSSSKDVFAVGGDNDPLLAYFTSIILHYDGSRWSVMKDSTGPLIADVWGTSASDVFAVGAGGTILHYGE